MNLYDNLLVDITNLSMLFILSRIYFIFTNNLLIGKHYIYLTDHNF